MTRRFCRGTSVSISQVSKSLRANKSNSRKELIFTELTLAFGPNPDQWRSIPPYQCTKLMQLIGFGLPTPFFKD